MRYRPVLDGGVHRAATTLRQRGWVAGYVVAAPLAVLVLAAWPDFDGLSVRLLIAPAVQLGLVGARYPHAERAAGLRIVTRTDRRELGVSPRM